MKEAVGGDAGPVTSGYAGWELRGPRSVVGFHDEAFPSILRSISRPPKQLYVVGDPAALCAGLAVVGARKATPYGLSCARRFAGMAAQKGIVIISGGAVGCDGAAHEAALQRGAKTVAFLGGGCDKPYPRKHIPLFQRIVDSGGAVVSEVPWQVAPMPRLFRMRNRLIAGLAKATLIVEAGLPSGTFSTADEALEAGRDVLVVPGSICAPTSHGANRLLCQGAIPVVDDETFEDALLILFGALKEPPRITLGDQGSCGMDDATSCSSSCAEHPLVCAALAQPLSLDEALSLPNLDVYSARDAARVFAQAEAEGRLARYPDGRWGPT